NLNKDLTVRNIKNTNIKLTEGDLVIEKSGGGEKQLVGRVVQLKNSFKNNKYTYSNFLGKLEIIDRMDKTYINYYFKNLYNARVTYNYIKQTTGIQNLDVDSLIKNEYFSLPVEKKEQEKISNFLDKKIAEIDNLIKKDKKLIELLQEKRTALINQVVTKGINPNARMKDSGIEWIGEIPKDWEIHRLKYISSINRKKLNESTKPDFK
ncbi:MAG: hypothetical protein RBT05_11455, partial [Bacteroidales bacterium]|nr:hypothetical protein [Bacteroidales bacterium]